MDHPKRRVSNQTPLTQSIEVFSFILYIYLSVFDESLLLHRLVMKRDREGDFCIFRGNETFSSYNDNIGLGIIFISLDSFCYCRYSRRLYFVVIVSPLPMIKAWNNVER